MAQMFILAFFLFAGNVQARDPAWLFAGPSTPTPALLNGNFSDLSNRIDSNFDLTPSNEFGDLNRVINGVITSTGGVVSGGGFSSVRNGSGDYTITFTNPFLDSNIYTLIVPYRNFYCSSIVSFSSSSVRYALHASTDVLLGNASHSFMIFGAK